MLGDQLIDVHAKPRIVAPFTDLDPGLTPEDAYRAAAILHRHRLAAGWKPIGRKIGFTNRTIWPRYEIYEPIWGMVYDRTFVPSRENEAEIPLAGLVQPRIEPEICFGLKARPRIGHLLDAIEWVAHSIEIVQCHHPDWKFRLPDTIAGNGLHGRLTLGERIPLERVPGLAEALPRLRVTLMNGERVVDRGMGSNVLDSPLAALAHLVSILESQPDSPPLEAGEIVSTGTLTDAHPVTPGETWSTQIAGLPLRGLTVRFT